MEGARPGLGSGLLSGSMWEPENRAGYQEGPRDVVLERRQEKRPFNPTIVSDTTITQKVGPHLKGTSACFNYLTAQSLASKAGE